MSKFWIQWCLR